MPTQSIPCDALIIADSPAIGEALASRMIPRKAHFGLLPGWWLRPANVDAALAVCELGLPETIAATRHLAGVMKPKVIISISWAIPADDTLHEGDVILATTARVISFPPFLATQHHYDFIPPDPLAPAPLLTPRAEYNLSNWATNATTPDAPTRTIGTAVNVRPPFHAGAYARDVYQLCAVDTLACAVAEAASLDEIPHLHASIIESPDPAPQLPWPSRHRRKLAESAALTLVSQITRLLVQPATIPNATNPPA